jgi:peptide/nickel transport system permease protein
VLLSVVVGVGLGLLSGFVGGKVDAFIMRVCDVMLSFPSILIALLIDGVGRAMFPERARHAGLRAC